MKLGRTEILKRGKAEKKTIRKFLLNINFIPKAKQNFFSFNVHTSGNKRKNHYAVISRGL